MPLFMFMAGYVYGLKKDIINISTAYSVVAKRFVNLIVPALFFMVVHWWFTGEWGVVYWFLRTLFLIILVFVTINCIVSSFKVKAKSECIIYLCFCIILFVAGQLFKHYAVYKVLDLRNLYVFYPYFVGGYLLKKYNLINVFLKCKVYSCTLTIFLFSFIADNYIGITNNHVHTLLHQVEGFSGILTLYHLSQQVSYGNIVNKTLCLFGQYSMAIYVLHPKFVPRLPELGDLLIWAGQVDPRAGITTFIQIAAGVLFAIYCCYLCVGLAKIIEKSKFWSCLVLGKIPK